MTPFHIRRRIHAAALRLASATASRRPILDFRDTPPEQAGEPIVEVTLRFYQPPEGGPVAIEQVLTRAQEGASDRTVADWLAFYYPHIGEALQGKRWTFTRQEVA